MTKYLPAGCKSAKVNLSGAYRTTLTRLEVGDVVRLDRRQNEVNGALIPTPTHSPARSFWATVTEITRANGQISITTDKGQMPADFAHTSITRKERATETQERLALDAQAREDAVRQAEEERIQTALAEHPTPAEAAAMPAPAVPAIPFMCGSHAHRTQAERTECQATAARLTAHTVPLADPADLAADLVRIGREGNIPEPITHALNVVGQLLDAADAADRAYYGKVYAELQTLLRRAMKVASDAAMRQVADPEPERAVLGEPMCLGDFGAYGACIAVPGHPGKCMDAFGHRFDGRNRRPAPVDHTHDFTPGHSGMVCVQMVERPDGTGDACGEPVNSAIHDPAAYQAFSRALDGELARLKDPARTATGKYVAGDGPLAAQDFVVEIERAAVTPASLRVGAQVWHPDFRGTVWVVWVIRHTGDTSSVDLVVPGTGDRLLGVNPDDVVRVTQENLDDYVASLAPVGKSAEAVAAFGALKRISERLTNGEVAQTKLLNAEGAVRNLLAEAKEVLDVAWARGGDQADAAAKARVDALTEVLALLVP